MALDERKPLDTAVAGLLVVTAIGFGVRMIAAKTVGLGDSEALYACYAKFPQAAYLDHPGLVGVFASALGGGRIPSPQAAHVATAALASMVPWLVVIVARSVGATARMSAIAGIVVAATPEIAVGLFGMTPDLLLAFLWLAFVGVSALAFEAEPKSARAAAAFAIAGLIAGVATSAKVTGIFLVPSMLVALDKDRRKTPWPWAGAAISVVPLVPIVQFESAHRWAMLRHRFVDTQHAAGVSFRNLGALLGGQLLYVSPVILVIAFIVARDLYRQRKEDDISRLLFWTFALPLPPLVLLCLWSRVAEPHWIAPPLLALPIHAARRGLEMSRKLVLAGAFTGLAMAGAVYVWVLSPSLLRYAPKSYDAKVDIANELFGWSKAGEHVTEMAQEADSELGMHLDTWAVGPSWMVCAQLQAAMPDMHVGCATDERTDFDDWAPRTKWEHADVLLFVTDDRMPIEPEKLIPTFHVERTERITIIRAGRIIRTFRVSFLEKRAAG
jgi:hypothetical protein